MVVCDVSSEADGNRGPGSAVLRIGPLACHCYFVFSVSNFLLFLLFSSMLLFCFMLTDLHKLTFCLSHRAGMEITHCFISQILSLWCTSWRWKSTPPTQRTQGERRNTCTLSFHSRCLFVETSRWSSSTSRTRWWKRYVSVS